MKHFFHSLFFICSFTVLSSFNTSENDKIIEDRTVYIFAFERVKNPTDVPDAYVYTPVIAITVDKELKFAHGGANNLEPRLKKFIDGEMGKETYNSMPCNCINYYHTKNEAEDKRLEAMAKHRRDGYGILHTPAHFSFSYNWNVDK